MSTYKLTHKEILVSQVEVSPHEPLEKALRRFKKKIEREGILKTLKARKHYEKPSEIKRRKQRNAIKNARKATETL